MEHLSTPRSTTGRGSSGVDSRPVDAAPVGTQDHPLEVRRLRAGYRTQKAIAEAAEISLTHYGNIVRGDATPDTIRRTTIRGLALALDVPFEDVLTELRDPTRGVISDQPLVVGRADGEGLGVVA